MKSNDWFHEEPPATHVEHITKMAESKLLANKQRKMLQTKRKFMWWTGMALVAASAVLWFRRPYRRNEFEELATLDAEDYNFMLEADLDQDADLLNDLELLESLEDENWG